MVLNLRFKLRATTLAAGFSCFLLAPLAHAQGSFCGNAVPPCDPKNPSSKCYQPPPPDPRCEPRECKKCTKSPCFVGSGAYVSSAVDLELPTTGYWLWAARAYESTHLIDGALGYGWTSSLTARLYYATYLLAAPNVVEREATITLFDGSRQRFSENPDGSFSPPLGRHDILTRNQDGTFDLTIQRTMSRLHFDSTGSLSWLSDDYGNRLVFSYAADGSLERVADEAGSGRFVDVYWGADGRISDLVDSAGREIGYTYNSEGLLTQVSDPLQRATLYTYSQGKYVPLLSSITDNWGRSVTAITYDTKDRVNSYTDRGETYTYTYNYQANPLKTAKTDSLGRTWVFLHGPGGLVNDDIPPTGSGGSTSHDDYYPDGSVQQSTDEVGSKTKFTYDSAGSILTLTRFYLTPNAVRYDYTYDPSFPGRVTSITARDPATGLVNPDWQSWRYDYYQAVDPAPGALRRVLRVESDGTTLDTMATYVYDDRGRILSVTNGDGGTTNYAYDAQGNLSTVTSPTNNDAGTRPVTSYLYDSLGRVTSKRSPVGSAVNYHRDSIGRLVSMTLPPPSAESPLPFTMSYSYDNFDSTTGLLFRVATDDNGIVTRQGFDAHDRPVESTNGLGAVTRRTYARDLLASSIDANGNTSSYTEESLKRLASVEFPDLTTERYTYFENGALKTTTDRNNQTITYAYDYAGRLAAKTYPNGGSISYSYIGQKLSQVVDTSASPVETHTFSYDSAYRLEAETQGPRGTLVYAYTPGDRRSSEGVVGGETANYTFYPDGSVSTISWSPVAGEFKFIYDRRGQYEEVIFPNGLRREYTYDDQGRPLVSATTDPVGGNLATYVFNYDLDNASGQPGMLGQRSSMLSTVPAQGFANSLTKYYYDDNYQLIRVDYPPAAPFNGEVGQWTYDLIGNRLTNTVNGQTQILTYQSAGTNPNNWQRLLSDGVNSYAFDPNGNVLATTGAQGSQSFTWDFEDRATMRAGAGTTISKYDFQSRRTTIERNSQSTSYLFGGDGPVQVDGESQEAYLYGPLRGELLATYQDGEVLFAVIDDHDSIVALADAAGQVRSETTFDVWGLARSTSGDVESRFGYLGRESDGDGLWLNDARYYSPSTGRFLQEDPGGMDSFSERQWAVNSAELASEPVLGESGQPGNRSLASFPSINVSDRSYLYGRNNPVMFRDSGGQFAAPGWIMVPILVWDIVIVLDCKNDYDKCYRKCKKSDCDCLLPGISDTSAQYWGCLAHCQIICDAQTRCIEKLIVMQVWKKVRKWIGLPPLFPSPVYVVDDPE